MKTRTQLLDRSVSEIMQRDVTTASPDMSVREVARVLADQGITGAPVVASDGRVEGVVSHTDVVRFTADAADLQSLPVSFPAPATGDWPPDDDDPVDALFGDYFLPEAGPGSWPAAGEEPGIGPLDEMTVQEIMTPVPFTLEASATIHELVAFLLRGRIHRAIVTDGGRLVGIVTATDVLRALSELEE